MFIYPAMAKYNIMNPIYKVGGEFDLYSNTGMASRTRTSAPKVFRPPTKIYSRKMPGQEAKRR